MSLPVVSFKILNMFKLFESDLVFQDLSIIIATKNHNPGILTHDFLKYSDIIPTDWELAQQPIVSEQVSQVIFNNAVSLIA